MKKILLLFLLLLSASCQTNERYANIFKLLDGHWKGIFYVYTDTLGQQEKNSQPTDISKELLQTLPLKLLDRIEVEQFYQSLSPYQQKVNIKDTHTDKSGEKITIESYGENLVVKGKLRCIVNKPSEQVIHEGIIAGNSTIIWQRNIPDPLKIEYFKETISESTYIIIGWGYYGDDDPDLSPKIWFLGEYTRIE